MRFPWQSRTPTPAPALREHADAMTDLRDKDREIDKLLTDADTLVGELRASLARASAALQESADEKRGDDDGR